MKRNEYPNKAEVIQFYINELHTVQECMAYFNMSKTKFYSCLKHYNIIRSKEDKSKMYSRVQNTQSVKDKIKQINLDKYGCINKSQLNSIIHFIDDTSFSIHETVYTVDWLKTRYIDENLPSEQMIHLLGISYVQLNRICKHYGISKTASQRYEIIRNNTVKKYGVTSTLQLDNVKEKSHQTLLKKYGTDNVMQVEAIKNKTKETNLKKYGVENFTQTSEYKESVRNTNIDKYGAPYPMQRNMEHLDIWEDKDLFIKFLKTFSKKPTPYDLMSYFHLTDRTVVYQKINNWELQEYVDEHPARSHYEDDIIHFLNLIGFTNIILNDRKILNGQEIDIYIPDCKLGIEFNGDYWHSDLFFNDHNGRSVHHQEKSLLAESKGIFLFQIFEHEWLNPIECENIKNRLKTILMKNNNKIPGRKCKVVELAKEQKKDFLNINHIQGNDHSTKQYGLMYNDELVACMTFVHPKNNKYTWELSRFCNKHGCTVQGGASKLFKYFIATLNKGDTISSYNDITKTKGDLYKILGFECTSINQPNYIWINFQTGDIRSRYQEQAGGEVVRMHSQNYHRVCDCGTKTWVYTVS